MSTEMSDATLFRTERVHPTVKSTSANAIVLPAFRAANGPKRQVAHDGQGGMFCAGGQGMRHACRQL